MLTPPADQFDGQQQKEIPTSIKVEEQLEKLTQVDASLLPTPPPLLPEGNKRKEPDERWCQRCGTVETPRWRYGPNGQNSLCNACHLRWKTLGKPADGYSATEFPPPFYNPQPITRKVKKIKKSHPKKVVDVKENIMPPTMSSSIKEISKAIPKENKSCLKENKSLAVAVEKSTITEVAVEIPPGACTSCKTKDTPLWRRGPLGTKTLCNACGLKWAKPNGTIEVEKTMTHTKASTTTTTSTTTSRSAILITTVKKPTLSSFLHYKKKYIKCGLYALENRIESAPKQKFSFPLPMHHGEFLISKQVDFELPPDIHQERELGLIKGLMADRQPFFTRIRSNIFVERKPDQKPNEQAVCHCVPPAVKEQMGCGDDCINRMLFYECEPKYCPCGAQCGNQRFQRKERKKELRVVQTKTRGWGLMTLKDIKKGDLVIEYRGEIISAELCEERMCTTYVNEKNFYFLDYCNGEVIDACTKGTEARFINHSCDPNCHIEKWSLRGESHFGVFASRDIQAKEELFYDYNFSTFNGSVESQQPCYCGTRACRGTIGKKGASQHKKAIA